MTIKVGFIVYDDFQLQHVAGPIIVFEGVCGYGAQAYEPVVHSERGGLVRASAGIGMDSVPFAKAAPVDILFIGGGLGHQDAARSHEIAAFVRARADECRHIVAISTGTVVLAASGLLDGRRVTTHWGMNKELAELYPAIEVGADDPIVRDGKYWTANTGLAGLEIARLIAEEDLGHDYANRGARDVTLPQKMIADRGKAAVGVEKFRSLMLWCRANLTRTLSIEDLAEQVGMTPRQFIASFTAVIGQTPAKAIERIRMEEALNLLGKPNACIEHVSQQVGFANARRMRRVFIRLFGVPPQKMGEIIKARRQKDNDA